MDLGWNFLSVPQSSLKVFLLVTGDKNRSIVNFGFEKLKKLKMLKTMSSKMYTRHYIYNVHVMMYTDDDSS